MTETTTKRSPIELLGDVVKRAVWHETGLSHDKGKLRVEFIYETLRVDLQEAERGQKEFVRLLAQFGETFSDESLERGVVYDRDIRDLVPADRVSMLEIFAFGKALDLWEVVTPKERRRNEALRDVVFQQAAIGSIGIIKLKNRHTPATAR